MNHSLCYYTQRSWVHTIVTSSFVFSRVIKVYLNNPLIVRNNSLRLAPSYYEGLPQLLRSFVSPLLWIRESIIYLILFRIRLYNTLLIMSIPFPEVDKTFIFCYRSHLRANNNFFFRSFRYNPHISVYHLCFFE